MIDKNLVLVAARHTPTALKEPCVWQHQTAESVADLPQDERVFAGDLCVFAASDGTKTAFRYEHYWECEGEKKFDVYAPEVIAENGTVTFTKDGEEVEELTYGDTVTVTVTADSGYQVKTITLNGEEIENGAEITVEGDILLIAEFEEAPAPSRSWTWDGISTSDKDIIEGSIYSHWVDEAPAYSASDYIGATLVTEIDGVESSYILAAENIQEMSEEGAEAILIDIEDTHTGEVSICKNVEGYSTGIYFLKYVDSAGEVPTHFTKSLTLAE